MLTGFDPEAGICNPAARPQPSRVVGRYGEAGIRVLEQDGVDPGLAEQRFGIPYFSSRVHRGWVAVARAVLDIAIEARGGGKLYCM